MLKISGIAGANHPTLKKGDAIPLSPEQKVCIAAREQLVAASAVGFKNLPLEAKVIGEVKVSPGRVVKNKTEEPQYTATVLVKYRRLGLKSDRIYPAQDVKIKIVCQDCRNDIGIHDLETIDFKIV